LYLHHLANVEHMPMATLISFCGGNSKASEIRNMIAAYNDMETYYRPLCDDDTQFDHRNFHGFVELQRKNVIDALTMHGFNKTDFSQWMMDDRFSILQDVRRLPEILKSKKAREIFLKENSREAKKILAFEATKLCRGEDEAKKALETATKTFEQGLTGADLPVINVDLNTGLGVLDAFLQIGFVASKGEARRLIKQSGLKINDKVVTDENYQLTTADLVDGQIKLSQGKKKHGLVKM